MYCSMGRSSTYQQKPTKRYSLTTELFVMRQVIELIQILTSVATASPPPSISRSKEESKIAKTSSGSWELVLHSD
eukprot:COSAG05_NODE_1411_length_4958_cov_2.723400_7_plen_75_part_00